MASTRTVADKLRPTDDAPASQVYRQRGPQLLRRRGPAGRNILGGLVLIFTSALFVPTGLGNGPHLSHLPVAAAALLGFVLVVNGLGDVIHKTRALRQV